MADESNGMIDDAADAVASDELLIEMVRDGDAEAYSGLYERHVEAARATAFRHARNSSDVSDLVAEAFANVLAAIQSGKGPAVFFRAYLLTTLRRLASTKRAADGKQLPVDDLETVMVAEAGSDPAVTAFERDVVGRSFRGLPERWQAVLWYTEVDELAPAEISSMLGISANAVAALAVRAREGLKQAYLQNHISAAGGSCAEYANNLGAYARGGLARRRTAKAETHLQQCFRCTEMLLHIQDVGVGMRSIIFPAVVGLAFAGSGLAKGAALSATAPVGSGAPAADVAGSGPGAAGFVSASLGSTGIGVVVTVSAVGVVLLGVVAASVVGLPQIGNHGNAGRGNTPTSVATAESQSPPVGTAAPGALTPLAAAASAVPEAPAELVISTVPPAPNSPLDQQGDLPLASPPAVSVAPGPAPPMLPQGPVGPESSAPVPAPSATATFAPAPTTAPTPTPAPTTAPPVAPTPTPENKATFSATGSVLSQTALETVLELEISSTRADLDSPKVSFIIPRLWMGMSVQATPPAGWSCVDSATVLTAGSTCAAAQWAGTSGTFLLSVPIPSILQGYPVEISVSAEGAETFKGWLRFNKHGNVTKHDAT